MSKNSERVNRIIKISLILLLIFFVGGVGGVYFDQQVLPFIRTNKYLSRVNFLKRSAENVTVINKTEQVIIKEDDSINEIASQASNAVVNIISLGSQKDALTKVTKNVDRSGTGIMVTSDGMLVTYRNAIIEENATYKILLFNGASYDAKLIGVDEFSNLAFLKIDANNLTIMSFADSNKVNPGKKVVAIGNSFGEYQNRYASGLLSNINKTFNLAAKTVASSEKLEGVFESDFNNQNAYVGGPVIGYSGELIGLEGFVVIDGQNKYFQIPSNAVQQVMTLAFNGDFSKRPFLGVYYIPITREYAIANDLSRDKGALIFSPSGKQGLAIISTSPAEKAGLKINDIVISVNEEEININNPLSNLISQYQKGDVIELKVFRDNKEIAISVSL